MLFLLFVYCSVRILRIVLCLFGFVPAVFARCLLFYTAPSASIAAGLNQKTQTSHTEWNKNDLIQKWGNRNHTKRKEGFHTKCIKGPIQEKTNRNPYRTEQSRSATRLASNAPPLPGWVCCVFCWTVTGTVTRHFGLFWICWKMFKQCLVCFFFGCDWGLSGGLSIVVYRLFVTSQMVFVVWFNFDS